MQTVLKRVCSLVIHHIFTFSAGKVPYNITVKALNLAGCGEEQQLYCFTEEGGSYMYCHVYYTGLHWGSIRAVRIKGR